MNRGAHDPELTDDLVGVASARLVAAGVPRTERVAALRLLSILATLADGDSRVRRPLVMVASEFDLPTAETNRCLEHLLAIGAVTFDGTTIVVGGREPSRHVGITLHDFLETAAELENTRRRRPMSVLRPSGALVAAAAAVVALALVGPGLVGDGSTAVSNTREAGGQVTMPTSPDTPTTTGSSGPSSPSDDGDDDDRREATTGAPTTEASPGTTVEDDRVGPVVATTTTTVGLPCPVGTPLIDVLGSTNAADGLLTVDGTAHNPTGQDLTIRAFELRITIGDEVLALPWLDRPIDVPAGSTVLWQSRLPIVAAAGALVEVALGEWEFEGPEPDVRCESP